MPYPLNAGCYHIVWHERASGGRPYGCILQLLTLSGHHIMARCWERARQNRVS